MLTLTSLIGFGAFTPVAASSYVTSVQTIEITIPTGATSATQTVSSVDVTKSVIFYAGFNTTDNNNVADAIMPRVELTNATTVTAYRNTSSGTHTVTVRATLVEFAASMISSVQAGTITLSTAQTSNTATISSVDTSRSVAFYLGQTTTSTADSPTNISTTVSLTNGTTVTANRNATGSISTTVGYIIVEFQAAVIASVQQRAVTITGIGQVATDTITAVDTSRSMLLYAGVVAGSATYLNSNYHINLTNTTTVTLTRSGFGSPSRTVRFTVVEFVAGVVAGVQRGTTTNNVTSADTSVTTVNTAKAVCNYTGYETDGSTHDERDATVKLNTSTQVRGQKNSAAGITTTLGWEVLEFN